MNDLKNNKLLIFVCIIFILSGILLYLYKESDTGVDLTDNYKDNSDNYLKNYDVNQYIPVYVTENDMAKNYLNDFKNKMISNVSDAFNCLNKDYREKRFGSLEGYQEYVTNILSLSTYSMEVEEYSVSIINGTKIFNIYDKDGYHYIFKELSIMNYEVYLDENTVIIK